MKGFTCLVAASGALLSSVAHALPSTSNGAVLIPVAEQSLESRSAQSEVEHGLARPVLVERQSSSSSTRNELSPTSPCKKVSLIFARGTFEGGNVGSFTGPPFIDALTTAIGANNLAVQGLAYPANVNGFFAGGDETGASDMAALVNTVWQRCPSTKFVLSGYSQGAQVVHKAVPQLSLDYQTRISAVVLFGDPLNSTAVGAVPASRVKVICRAKDNICAGGYNFFGEHLNYRKDAGAAAAFVKSNVVPL